MNEIKIFQKYMKPFLETHGFKKQRSCGGDFLFYYKDSPEIKIDYQTKIWSGGSLKTDIYKNYKEGKPIPLTFFYGGPENVCEYLNLFWYYDTEEELIGIYEKQAELFEAWVFDWMFGKIELDIRGIYENFLIEQRKIIDSGSSEEINKAMDPKRPVWEKYEKWSRMRFKNHHWK